jgi:hypothetical protein
LDHSLNEQARRDLDCWQVDLTGAWSNNRTTPVDDWFRYDRLAVAQGMREPIYPIIVALASMLVAPPFSSFAQREERGPSRLEEQTPLRRPQSKPRRAGRRSKPCRVRKHSAATSIMVNLRGEMVAGITRRAMVGTAGGGMLADSGISIPSRSKVRPTMCPTLRLRMTRWPLLRPQHRHPRKNPIMLSIIVLEI